MKKILVSLLVLAMLFVSLAAPAEEGGAVTLELDTARLPVYSADDPQLAGLTSGGGTLPVILLSVKKALGLRVQVLPRTVRNKKVTLTVDNEEAVRVKGTQVAGLKPGEAVLTIASEEDPSAVLQYRIVVVQPVTRITLNAPKTLAAGASVALEAACLPEDASVKRVVWSSAAEDIATVDENGTVTGLKRGNARISAVAADGSNIRANVSIQITQSPEEITLDKTDVTIDVKRNATLKPTVLPAAANNKKVIWSSSDESVATVNASGRITAVALGDCEIICTSQEAETVQARASVHVQQPVQKIVFGEAPAVYNGETAQLAWSVEPANASNPKLSFTSGNEKVLTVSEDGVITGVLGGDTFVKAVSTDGSNRQARLNVKVFQHLTGAHMLRKTAYIDVDETATAGAVLEPSKAKNVNKEMTWESDDPLIASVAPEKGNHSRVRITGVTPGTTTVVGTTEDGGFQAPIKVKVGHWDKALKITGAKVRGADGYLTVKNDSDLTITSITVEVTVYDADGKMVPSNKKDKKKPHKMVYTGTLKPGASTKDSHWKTVDFKLPDSPTVSTYVFKVVQFEINHDWIKTIRKKNQPTKKAPVHL